MSVHDHDLDDLSDQPQEDQELDSRQPDGDDPEPTERPDDLQPASRALLLAVGTAMVAIVLVVVVVIVWAVS